MKSLSEKFIDALIVKQARHRLTYKQLSMLTNVNEVTVSKIVNHRVEAVQEKTFDKLNDWLLSEDK